MAATAQMRVPSSGPASCEKTTSFCSRLLYSRPRLKQIAQQTTQIATHGGYLNSKGNVVGVGPSLRKAMGGSVHYHHTHKFQARPSPSHGENCFETKFHVFVCSSLEPALALQGGHVGVLNSGSGKRPGGRFRDGTISQEDCICRATLLFKCLEQFADKEDHFYRINNKLPKGISTSCAIFSPRVPVVRRDNVEASLLDEIHEISFVTIPAPNAFIISKQCAAELGEEEIPEPERHAKTQRALRDAMADRIFRALSIFAEHGCTDLVLSAFGCGVHGNDPDTVASIFQDLLTKDFKGQFDNVVFTIHPSRYGNYKSFAAVFGD
eukprot:CAMPEP_0183321700 /NCGR_PEP_ID=MMETSP0160_2-20130417/69518_1 /TAXON_ID=2839 ORGANISM="Odontella Sinensis, Strain Grunow 1884" /NCGR_SAMPLE_ID=MMETSP0160_2 /ASSEMBLY_ACC=CAM_ASM_000250 /LENGTH=322 /DNA_ID=CAMNT_0025488685 /DNA_START=41 /DNA_END=1009 /DNA_ORIENTATION=+